MVELLRMILCVNQTDLKSFFCLTQLNVYDHMNRELVTLVTIYWHMSSCCYNHYSSYDKCSGDPWFSIINSVLCYNLSHFQHCKTQRKPFLPCFLVLFPIISLHFVYSILVFYLNRVHSSLLFYILRYNAGQRGAQFPHRWLV